MLLERSVSLHRKALVLIVVLLGVLGLITYLVSQRNQTFTTESKATLNTRLVVLTGVVHLHPSRPNTYILVSGNQSYILEASTPEDQGVVEFSQFLDKTVIAYGRLITTPELTLAVQRIVMSGPTSAPTPRPPCNSGPGGKIQCPPQPPIE